MRFNLVLVLLISLPCWAQTGTTTGQADTTAPCSVANTGNGNKIQITCGIGKEQGQQVLAILNKILANQLDPNAVMAKLDEILKGINPNNAPKVYNCAGFWRTFGPSSTAMIELNSGGDDAAFHEMVRLNNSKQYIDLLKACKASIRATPQWLTPRLFCSLAYVGTGDEASAREMLTEFESRTGPPYDAPECNQISAFLHQNLH